MDLRRESSRWFEAYVPRQQTVYALEILAGRGDVELEAYPSVAAHLDLSELKRVLSEFDALEQRYGRYWPHHQVCPTLLAQPPEDTARQALVTVRARCEMLDRLLAELRECEDERAELEALQELVATAPRAGRMVRYLAQANDLLYKALYACPSQDPASRAAPSWLVSVIHGPQHVFLLVVAPPAVGPKADTAFREAGCRRVRIPRRLSHGEDDLGSDIAARIAALQQDAVDLHGRIAVLRDDNRMIEALGELELLRWYVARAPRLATQEQLCHVSGWTSEPDASVLDQALRRAGIDAIVRTVRPPGRLAAPVRTPQGWVARLFEPYVRMYGTPGREEVEPSGALIAILPLLFGYMFPDIGHGLVLLIVSAGLYSRWPASRFLIPCSLAAIAFGFVFGEVFGIDDLVTPLWGHPLEHPLLVLAFPLVFGAAIILLGFVFAAVQARWRGELRQWFLAEGAVPVIYVAALAVPFVYPVALYIAGTAVAWYLIGSAWLYRRRLAAGLALALGRLADALFSLAINTVSFARVGAFALAHAGFSQAVMAAGDTITSPLLYWMFFVIGHGLIVALEALVVFVQTTRLIFFEFFLRFLRAEGRLFRPLSPP